MVPKIRIPYRRRGTWGEQESCRSAAAANLRIENQCYICRRGIKSCYSLTWKSIGRDIEVCVIVNMQEHYAPDVVGLRR